MLSSISGLKETGLSRNGRMEQNFLVIPIFRNLRPTIARYTQMSVLFSPPPGQMESTPRQLLTGGMVFSGPSGHLQKTLTLLMIWPYCHTGHTVWDMKNKSQALKEQDANVGLKINATKKKLVCIQSHFCTKHGCAVLIEGEQVSEVDDEFRYLSSIVCKNGGTVHLFSDRSQKTW